MKFAKAYEPAIFEPTAYEIWERSDVLSSKGKGEPYSIVMPPPNANGNLHIGHGLVIALEDILTRFYRLKGYDTVYIPGADHAGFETWVVYEKALEKIGKSRFDFSREQLYSQVWNFVEEQRGNMELQLRVLGASCSWKDLVFTLDKKVVDTVYKTFKRLWDDGLVYRGEKIVNYCTKHQTSFADIEVSYDDAETPLYYIKYGPFVLATTRPETKFGDTAVAVHPEDKRYKKYIGEVVTVEGVNGPFAVTVVADEMVDPNFGTGVVKVTPAHSFDDWEVAQRHRLVAKRVINMDGKMNEGAGRFEGMTVLEAREAVVEEMKKRDMIVKIDEHYKTRIGSCYKCGTVIEPMLMEQWFINVRPLADRAIEALKNGDIKFTPENKGKVLIKYLENLKDWNISRQIPWGIPIPAFKRAGEAEDNGLENPDAPLWIFDEKVEESEIVVNGTTYIRDEDTFDTWFSSGQWPFITTDFLEKGKLSKFYPLDVMETGGDLLFPWVSRMIMLGLYATNEVPFKEVYLHGLVLDEHGQKMSKSKGNVINPVDVIGEYGSDAFRLGIVASRSAGQNQAFSISKVVAGRNLCNKLWNIARYIQDTVGDDFKPSGKITNDNQGEDWVIRELMKARDELDRLMREYRFAEASELVYQVIWSSVADWYIETSKKNKNSDLMAKVLEICLKLIHPFAPFVSETIWQNLNWTDSILAGESWIEDIEYDEISAANFERLQKLVTEIRFVTNELPAKKKYPLLYMNDILIDENKDLIKFLVKAPEVVEIDMPRGMRLANSGREAWLDVDAKTLQEHRANLQDRLWKAEQEGVKLKARLLNKNYIEKAPKELVDETKKSLEYQEIVIERLKNELTVI
jgi:valyl-tRNA synthetase